MNVGIGDMAVVVGFDREREVCDLGKIVQVVKKGEDWSFVGDSRAHWGCVSETPLIQFCEYTNEWSWSEPGESTDIPDQHLRRIELPSASATDRQHEELVA